MSPVIELINHLHLLSDIDTTEEGDCRISEAL